MTDSDEDNAITAADIDAPPAAPKKRKKPAPLTAKTLVELRKRGWSAQVVERWMPHTHVKVDLFGVIDIVAIRPAVGNLHARAACGNPSGWCYGCASPAQIVGIQVTGSRNSNGNIATHRTKILAEPRAKEWVAAGGALELWGWRMVGHRWRLTIETYAEMEAAAR